MMKKLVSLLLCGTCALAIPFAGCDRGGENQTIDEGKTQLYVKYYNGGLGREWIDNVITSFEQDYANYSFEEGKTGVQIMKDFEKANVNVTEMKETSNQVFLLVDTNYFEFVTNDVMLDITDVVQGKAALSPDSSENVTVESKITEDRKAFYNWGDESNPEYYALPFFENSINLNYNVDLFERKGFYFKKGATAEGMSQEELNSFTSVAPLFVGVDTTAERSYGPDGKTGIDGATGVNYSLDDGLPATYDDFAALVTYIRTGNVLPFIWNGYEPGYLTCLANDMWANNEGLEQMSLNFDFDGTATDLVVFDEQGNVKYKADGSVETLPATPITNSNAYMLQAQKGKLEAIELIKIIMGNKDNYYTSAFSPSFTHEDAQDYFISGYDKGYIDKEIAMLVEGTWWNREGSKFYGSPEEKMTKRFAILPLPKSDASAIGENNTKVTERQSLIFINKYCDESVIPAAKTFVSYLQSDKAMNTFSQYTDMLRAMNYDLTEDTLSKMSYYGRNVYEFSRSATTDWIEWLPTSDVTKKNFSMLSYRKWGYSTAANKDNPFEYFYKDKSNTSRDDYFEAIYKYRETVWSLK